MYADIKASISLHICSLTLSYYCVADTAEHSVFSDGLCCVEVLRPSQPNGVMSSAVSLPNHTFTGQA